MVNSWLCKTARPQFQNTRPRVKNSGDSETQNHPKTRLWYPFQMLPRCRDWAKIFQTHVLLRNHSLPLIVFSLLTLFVPCFPNQSPILWGRTTVVKRTCLDFFFLCISNFYFNTLASVNKVLLGEFLAVYTGPVQRDLIFYLSSMVAHSDVFAAASSWGPYTIRKLK